METKYIITSLLLLLYCVISGGMTESLYGQQQSASGYLPKNQTQKRLTSPLGDRSGSNRVNVPAPGKLPSQRLASLAPAVKAASNKSSCLLKSARQVGKTDLIEIVVEGTGKVSIGKTPDAPTGEKMELVAGFRYEEQTSKYNISPKFDLECIRQYEQAGMKYQLGGRLIRPLLDASRKNIVCRFDGKTLNLFSPTGCLKSDQYLLLSDMPCNTLLLDLLLPNREVKLGEEWTISTDVLQAILNLEAIENNTARFVLTAIIDDIAEVDFYLQGGKDEKGELLPSTLEGAWQGASVAMELTGKYQFDLKTGRMTWFGLKAIEQRSDSLIEPGIDWTALVRVKIAPLAETKNLTPDVVHQLKVKETSELKQLYYDGKNGPWTFYHGRQWWMTEDTPQTAALCLIMNGEGVAQCNINANELVERDKMAPLSFYKEEIKKSLAERFGSFVKDMEFVNEAGYLVYAVVVDGEYDDMKLRWIYYLLTSPEGCQTSVVFEIRADMLDKFSSAGEQIVDSLRMVIPDNLQQKINTATSDTPQKPENKKEEKP